MPLWSALKRAESPDEPSTHCEMSAAQRGDRRPGGHRFHEPDLPRLSASIPKHAEFYLRIQVSWWPLRPSGCERDNVDSNSSVKFGRRSSSQRSVSFLKGTGGIVFTDPDVTRCINNDESDTHLQLTQINNQQGDTKIIQRQPNYDMDCLKKMGGSGEEKAEEEHCEVRVMAQIIQSSFSVQCVWFGSIYWLEESKNLRTAQGAFLVKVHRNESLNVKFDLDEQTEIVITKDWNVLSWYIIACFLKLTPYGVRITQLKIPRNP